MYIFFFSLIDFDIRRREGSGFQPFPSLLSNSDFFLCMNTFTGIPRFLQFSITNFVDALFCEHWATAWGRRWSGNS
jgi:hypothetical protein